MQILKTNDELRALIAQYKQQGKSIGFVPTMGYLHQGHVSLMKLASNECDIVIVSIFVNPLQFGPGEDLDKYPRDIPADTALCHTNQVDVLYLPDAHDLLGKNLQLLTYVNITGLDQHLCGARRPGHFKGVCTIVCKLFNLVTPDKAYLGKKDIQQLRIIEQMVSDLNFPIQIIGGETYRDSDGLALSSRNSYLSEDERKNAVIVPQTLECIRRLVNSGMRNCVELISQARQFIDNANIANAKLDYIEIVDNQYLQKVTQIDQSVIVAIALYIGKTRLIDNILLHIETPI